MRKILVAVAALGLLLVACASENPTVSSPSAGASAASAADCAKNVTTYVNAGKLTVGTDNPAYPPWFAGDNTKGTNWKINNPATGEGFESAVAYAVAGKLGFSSAQAQWVEVPFGQSFKPGPKDFDFDINQISYKSTRAEAVDFSQSYYDANQSLVAIKGTAITNATTLSELKQYKFGTQIGTTGYDYIANNIQPTQDMAVFDTTNDAITALKNGQIDGIVVDLPSAFFMTAVQIPNGVIVGQFPTVGQQEYFGMVFQKGSSLVGCVNMALDELKADGTLQTIQEKWLSQVVNVPVFSAS
jgi:polar amino acid transport system substrate-binding protein